MSVVITEYHDRAMCVVKCAFTFTGTSEAASSSTKTTHSYYGFVVQCLVDEDGTNPPPDNWDLTVTDEFGVDLLNGKGTNLTDDTTITQADLDNGMACSGQIQFSAAQVADGDFATVYLYITRYQ